MYTLPFLITQVENLIGQQLIDPLLVDNKMSSFQIYELKDRLLYMIKSNLAAQYRTDENLAPDITNMILKNVKDLADHAYLTISAPREAGRGDPFASKNIMSTITSGFCPRFPIC